LSKRIDFFSRRSIAMFLCKDRQTVLLSEFVLVTKESI
jgi:hypothetical protein